MSRQKDPGFAGCERGSVLIEALIAFPILTIVSFGLLEFGNLMWQREQLQAGVRDAARYWSRCRPATATYASTCDEQTARNIAFYGHPLGAGYGQLRVPGWDQPGEIVFSPDKSLLSSVPDPENTVVVTGSVVYQGSPAFGLILSDEVTINSTTEMRSIGW
ncbi:TadE/TadG family type IV pilus assembly protein [Marimonas lutisalis]|uniref:TadE/TadG family type IV pilus assembly protein n=1 Tax=Marimonas lutisalis TaxID=2545756 RepID=UPI0010F5A0F9|nr:TadE family protein [Marimonas lutisalis]